jgi:RNA polymerase sigma factor (TIGR02999 family)
MRLGSRGLEFVSVRGGFTELLGAVRAGEAEALDRLVSAVYPDLRRLAARHLRGERVGHTLQPTALVHELYLQLLANQRIEWRDRAHFFAVAARLMRRILVDYARGRSAQKRGGGVTPVSLDELALAGGSNPIDLLLLDEVLDRLAARNARQAEIVELRIFGGLDTDETCEALGVSASTVKRDWRMARAWLSRELRREAVPPSEAR